VAPRVREIARVDVTEAFASNSTPTLYIAGAHDRLVGANVIDALRRLRPDLHTLVVDAPHLVLQRAPREAAALLNAFSLDSNREVGSRWAFPMVMGPAP
jgi:pimeloyl-ACP methyl ester carboxylesterase